MNLLFLFISLFSFSKPGNADIDHPIHVSISEVRYNEDESAFQVSLKIFIDDLELGMKRDGFPPLNLGSAKENQSTLDNLSAYVDKYFTIQINNEKLSSTFVGKEISDDYLAVWCYVEFPAKVSKGQKCSITNKVLLDLYDDQRNIMDIRIGKTYEAHAILDPSTPSWNYTF